MWLVGMPDTRWGYPAFLVSHYLFPKTRNMNHRFLLILVSLFPLIAQAQPRQVIDSVKSQLNELSGIALVEAYRELTIHYRMVPEGLDSAEYYADALFALSDSLDYELGRQRGWYYQGMIYWFRDEQYARALQNFLEVQQSIVDSGDTARLFSVQDAIGSMYRLLGNYELALEYYQRSLNGALLQGVPGGAGIALGNIALIRSDMGDVAGAIAADRKSLVYTAQDTTRNQFLTYSVTYLNLVDRYLKLDSFDQAQGAIDTLHALIDGTGNFREEGRLAVAEMKLLDRQERYAELFELAKYSVERFESVRGYDLQIYLVAYYHYTSGLIRQGKVAEARTNIERIVELMHGVGSRRRIQMLQFTADLYEQLGEAAQSLQYFKAYQEQKDSLLNAETTKQLAQLQTIYDVARKEKELEQATNKTLVLQQRVYGLVAALAIILSVAGGFYYLVQRSRHREQEKMNQIEQKMLSLQMNPHFIFNAISSIQNYLFDEKDRTAAITHLSTFAALMRQMLENSREKFISLQEEVAFLENYLSLQKLRFENKFDFEIEIDSTLDVDRTSIPPLLTQPFVENAIEHGKIYLVEHGRLYIRILQASGELTVRISDNGIGLKEGAIRGNPYPVKKKSLSIAITRERLQLLSKLMKRRYSLEIVPNPNAESGTLVALHLPYIQAV